MYNCHEQNMNQNQLLFYKCFDYINIFFFSNSLEVKSRYSHKKIIQARCELNGAIFLKHILFLFITLYVA